MSRVKIPISIIAVAISIFMFVLSWNAYGSGLSIALLPDAAKSFVAPANSAIDAWNAFAAENGVKAVVTEPIVLNGTPLAAQPESPANVAPEDTLVDSTVVTE